MTAIAINANRFLQSAPPKQDIAPKGASVYKKALGYFYRVKESEGKAPIAGATGVGEKTQADNAPAEAPKKGRERKAVVSLVLIAGVVWAFGKFCMPAIYTDSFENKIREMHPDWQIVQRDPNVPLTVNNAIVEAAFPKKTFFFVAPKGENADEFVKKVGAIQRAVPLWLVLYFGLFNNLPGKAGYEDGTFVGYQTTQDGKFVLPFKTKTDPSKDVNGAVKEDNERYYKKKSKEAWKKGGVDGVIEELKNGVRRFRDDY